MKAIIYARCSTNDTKQDVSLQTEPLIEFCKRYQWEYSVMEEYASGKDTKNRPVFNSVMEMAYQKEFDVLIVTKLDRLSRSMVDFVNTALKLDQYGVRLIAKDQGIDTDQRNPASKLLMNVIASMAEFERSLISERVKAGIAKRRKEGKTVGKQKKALGFPIGNAIQMVQEEKMSYRKVAKAMGCDVNTLIRRVKEYEKII